MKVTIVIGAFDTVTKELLKGLEDLEVGEQVETIQTTTLLRTARILRRILETWGDLLSLKFQWKIISVSWCEKRAKAGRPARTYIQQLCADTGCTPEDLRHDDDDDDDDSGKGSLIYIVNMNVQWMNSQTFTHKITPDGLACR